MNDYINTSFREISSRAIHLLVVDETLAVGGVENAWFALMPELAKFCQHIVWMQPEYRIRSLPQELKTSTAITYESFDWPYWSIRKLKAALSKRIFNFLNSIEVGINCFSKHNQFDARLNFLIRKYRITHVHYPALFTQPFPLVSVPVSATVHDVNYDPSWYDNCIDNLAYWASQADCLMANSHYTKSEVAIVCPRADDTIVAVPYAIDLPTLVQPSAVPGTLPSLYYPASFNFHKGHALLLNALHLLYIEGIDFRLVLTGNATNDINSKDPLNSPALESARCILTSANYLFQRKILVKGRVSTEEVDSCFARASLVVLPSQYEGFGLPLAEAVARGKRVLCSDIPAFREQVELYGFDQAVTFVDGQCAEAWASAIKIALHQTSQSPYTSEQLNLLFKRRTWRNVAEEYSRLFA